MTEHPPRAIRTSCPPATFWFTGYSGAGKTTLAGALQAALAARGVASQVLDGDELRRGAHADLDFSPQGRAEQVRRTGELALALQRRGLCALVCLVSPYRAGRDAVRRLHEAQGLRFVEVHVDTPLDRCAAVDAKGLYARARSGVLRGLTGIDAPYEAPVSPQLRLSPFALPREDCVRALLEALTPP